MANYVSTNIRIYPAKNDKDCRDLQCLYTYITKVVACDKHLFNLAETAGLNTENMHCKGIIIECDIEHGYILIVTETAWEPALKIFFELIKKYCPGKCEREEKCRVRNY